MKWAGLALAVVLASSACVVQTEQLDGHTGPQGLPGTAGVSPFSYVDPVAMTDIHYDGGRVGLGTPVPIELLHVNGNIHLSGAITTTNWITHTEWHHLNETNKYSPGYWKLVTPIGDHEENAFSIHVAVYRYAEGGIPLDIRCGGYAYEAEGLVYAACKADGTGDPVGIGAESGVVVVTIGSSDYGGWYSDYATFEYVGKTPKKASDFHWVWMESATPPFPNNNRVVIDDATGGITIPAGGSVCIEDNNRGVILRSPSGTYFKLQVTDGGEVVTQQVAGCFE